jgi:hypothetical protein
MISLKVTISPDLLALPEKIRAALTEGQKEGAQALVAACQQSMRDVDRVASGETAASARPIAARKSRAASGGAAACDAEAAAAEPAPPPAAAEASSA